MWWLLACTQSPDPGTQKPGDPPDPGTGGEGQHLVRLTHNQWNLSVMDLLQLDAPPTASTQFVQDTLVGAFDRDADDLIVDPTLWMQYQAAAEDLAEEVVSSDTRYQRVVPQDQRPSGGSGPGIVERGDWITKFLRRAFRREPSGDEIRQHQLAFADGAALFPNDDPFRAGVRVVITATLQSPHFLYRTEGVYSDDADVLGPYELASRLSYSLWNEPPDDELRAAAAEGLDEELLTQQLDRMFALQETHEGVRDMHWQMYHVDGYDAIYRPSEEVLGIGVFDDSVPAWMQREVVAFVDDVVFSGGTVSDLLLRPRTFVNDRLAPVYGLSVQSQELVPRDLDPTRRAGLLTLSGFLAWQADRHEPKLIGRGGFVNEVILCADLPPPAANATPLPEPTANSTPRERVEEHTTVCGTACHARINPVGFALGRFDEEGKWDPDPELDTTGTYPFASGEVSFDGAVELSQVLAARPEVHQCYVEHLVEFLEGRSIRPEDEPRIEALAEESLNGRPIVDLMRDIVADEAFRRVR